MNKKLCLALIVLFACSACSKKVEPLSQSIKAEVVPTQECPVPQVIEKTVEVPKIVYKIVYKDKIVEKEVVREKIVYVEKGSPEAVNNIFSAYASYGPSGNLLNQQYGNINYAVAQIDATVGFQYQRRVYNNWWGLAGADLHGNYNLGIGYSFK